MLLKTLAVEKKGFYCYFTAFRWEQHAAWPFTPPPPPNLKQSKAKKNCHSTVFGGTSR
ncbi:hypothetical protein PVAP13_4NG106019 [Panicum virgatum]|uniref:Uncharacterized protein n=1 Tax=Panicum virgatum TaxID=38727 RepID=A0A8T0T277_PANVG|nr:hypothetical protein PVAP13_4NG106019 [Panicum virgatum]